MADGIFSSRGAEHLARAFGNFEGLRRLPDAKLFWPEEPPNVIARGARRLWAATRTP